MHAFPIPVVALGPGSQSETETLDYLPMPHDMRTYRAPCLPEDDALSSSARAWLADLLAAVRAWRPGDVPVALDLAGLAEADRRLIAQVLGEGEVSAKAQGEAGDLAIQESVFAGVWRVLGRDPAGRAVERVEVGDLPAAIRAAHATCLPAPARKPLIAGVVNATALLREIAEHAARPPGPAHIINLSLLPFTPEDGAWLDDCLGRGAVSILSRGYGNCRITAAGVARVWWVQYFNSQDALILNTIEICAVPEVARAAAEDLTDSAERLAEVLDWLG